MLILWRCGVLKEKRERRRKWRESVGDEREAHDTTGRTGTVQKVGRENEGKGGGRQERGEEEAGRITREEGMCREGGEYSSM